MAAVFVRLTARNVLICMTIHSKAECASCWTSALSGTFSLKKWTDELLVPVLYIWHTYYWQQVATKVTILFSALKLHLHFLTLKEQLFIHSAESGSEANTRPAGWSAAGMTSVTECALCRCQVRFELLCLFLNRFLQSLLAVPLNLTILIKLEFW